MVSIARLSRLDQIRLTILAFTTLVAWLLASGVWSPEFYQRLNFGLDDWRQSETLAAAPDPRIALIDIDERSIAAIGPWPWPRAVMARLTQNLFSQYHTQAVGLDILFPEAGAPDDDRTLLDVAHHYPLVFAQTFDLSSDALASHAGHANGALPASQTPSTASKAPLADGFIGNFFDDPHVCVGHVTPHIDSDGVVRSIPPLIRYAGATYPMLAWQILHCHTGGPSAAPAFAAAASAASSAAPRWSSSAIQATAPSPALSITDLPIDQHGLMHIPFKRSLKMFDVVPAVEVLAGNAPPALLKNRYVLVGSSAIGLTDHIASPIDPWLPAVIVHAELLTDILDAQAKQGYTRPTAWLPILWTGASIIAFALLLRLQRASVALPALIAATGLWLALALSTHLVPVDMTALPLVTALIFLLLQAPLEWISSQAEIRMFERRFSRYLPPTVLREIIRHHGLTAFKPERRQITVLFVDIEDYTRLAEQMPPERLVAMTEVILTRLTRCVYDTVGTLDKYMGDALMAFWGAPLEQQDHADRALDCARAMLHELADLNRNAETLFDGRTIRVRIGINSGSAVVGELGSTSRQSYTAIGDAINVASRLQEYAKIVKTDLLIGQEAARLAIHHKLRAFGYVTLRGRVAPELLYVLDESETDAVV